MNENPSMPSIDSPAASILVVDDQDANVLLLRRLLGAAGYKDIRAATDPLEGLRLYQEEPPDLLLLDIQMPVLDGFGFLQRLEGGLRTPGDFIPVVVLTADATDDTRRRALDLGASDFLTKPFDAVEVLLRIRNLLHTRRLHIDLTEQNLLLELRVHQRTEALVQAQEEIVERLTRALEFRDDTTGEHILRVGTLSGGIAQNLGQDDAYVTLLRLAARMHDIGKIGVPDGVLLKPGPLDADEYRTIQTHSPIGGSILQGGSSDLMRMAEDVARYHHERWDGSGSEGMAGTDIPLSARIVAVADVFDALVNPRPYKAAWTVDDGIAEITAQRGRQFDPEVVDAFLAVITEELAASRVPPRVDAGITPSQ